MIKRNLYSELKQHLTAREMTLVVGPRQSGKTTLLRLLAKELEKTDKNVLFLNLDVEADAHHFQSQQHLIRKIELEFGSAREGFVFIDEIQRKENAGIFLKGLYDQMLPYKFIVSGSGSLELKEKIQESLAGRKRLFELSPVTFDEFVHYQTEYKYADNFSQFVKIERERLNFLLIEYMNFGGYPRIVTESDAREKYLLIDEIFRSYVEKDLVYLLHIDRPEVYRQLIRLLANQTGKLVNFSKLAANLNVSLPTVKKYIWFAQKTFIIDMITPFARNFKKEITRSPMTYFWDLGLCLFSLGRFGGLLADAAPGFLFQNFVYNLVKQKCNSFSGMLHFWRTTDHAEVDLVLERGNDLVPIEIKFSNFSKPVIGRSLRSFISKYNPQQAWVVNLNFFAQIQVAETNVRFIPYYQLLLPDFWSDIPNSI